MKKVTGKMNGLLGSFFGLFKGLGKLSFTLPGTTTKVRPLLLLLPLLLVVGLVLGMLAIFGDDDGFQPGDAASGIGEGDASQLPGSASRNPKPAPRVRTGVVDEARRIGRLAVAQARGTIVEPTRVRIRVSAAPKQKVTVNWQLGCFLNRKATIGRDEYSVTPFDVREIKLPITGAETCIATATAQLTDPDGEGRIKVAIIAG